MSSQFPGKKVQLLTWVLIGWLLSVTGALIVIEAEPPRARGGFFPLGLGAAILLACYFGGRRLRNSD